MLAAEVNYYSSDLTKPLTPRTNLQGARLRGKRESRHVDEGSDQDAEDGESDDASIEEEINVETPLDSVDPAIRFKAALTSTCGGSKVYSRFAHLYIHRPSNVKPSRVSGRNDNT